MGQLFSTEDESQNDKHVLSVYKKWMKCFYYCEEQKLESVYRIMNNICVVDKKYIKTHVENYVTRITTPKDFVTCKVINTLSPTDRILYLKPWSYYMIRESNKTDEFILSDDIMDTIASRDDHIFWTVLKVINKRNSINLKKIENDCSFWTRMFILTGDQKHLYKYANNNNIDLRLYENFREKHSPIPYSFTYIPSSESE